MPDRKTVLIIGDEISYLVLMTAIIEQRCDAHAAQVTSASEALVYLETHQPDCIMLSPRMPEIDGIEFLRMWRNQPHYTLIPVLGMTIGGTEWETRLREGGVDALLTMPFTVTGTVDAVQSLLGDKEL